MPQTYARLHYLDRLTLKGLRDLDREKTLVMLPVGMLEVHGDHLPLGTDTVAVDAITLSAAAWLLEEHKDLHVLLLPTIPYGTDPVDLRRTDLFQTAGSVWLSVETLKAVVTEVLEHLVRFGFKKVFPIGFHGGPEQCIALDQVCISLRQKHPDLTIIEPVGYVLAGAGMDVTPGLATLLGRPLTAAEEVSLNSSIHASMFETSMMLYLAPELVDHVYKTLRSIEWRQMYNMPDWPGYVGAGPAHANAEVGGAVLRWRGVRAGHLIDRALAGQDFSNQVRHPRPIEDDYPPANFAVHPVVSEPHIDSKPAMYISPADLAQVKAAEERKQAGPKTDDTVVGSENRTPPTLNRLSAPPPDDSPPG